MKMILNVGDWSDDGHGKNKEYVFDVNYSVEEIREAYKASCKKTGLSFNGNDDYTGVKRDRSDVEKYRLFNNYEESYITKLQFDILKEYIPEEKLEDFFEDYDETDEEFYLYDMDNFPDLWWEFVKISLPDLEVKIEDKSIPSINGFDGLPVHFGYGLFY